MEAITKDGIFNSNELYLLQNFEANLVNINLKIAEQENKRNECRGLYFQIRQSGESLRQDR